MRIVEVACTRTRSVYRVSRHPRRGANVQLVKQLLPSMQPFKESARSVLPAP
jgi:hypothetical protein